jgi:pyruvate/2-oxoglutarate dehydrogenase complex dihydrolipoamide dehydrogenase (E3) component
MFKKLDLILAEGPARFVDERTVEVDGVRRVRGKKIFICTGTSPSIPAIPGIESVPILTNENLYELNEVPKSMIVIGGGAIGCEMGQALSRLGTKVTILNAAEYLLPRGDVIASQLLCEEFTKEGIEVVNSARVNKISRVGKEVTVSVEGGQEYTGETLLLAAGRKIALDELKLENAGVKYDSKKGIHVDDYLRTSKKHIFAVGDCNGYRLFTHAAMHQGMIALINAISPAIFRKRYKKYVVPWSVFTEPEVSQVGDTESELRSKGVKYEVIESQYADYGRSTADGCEVGFVKALVSKFGKIYGVTIVGEGSSEMIHEFGLAIQERKRLSSILFLQHSFPTYSFVNKRIAEIWLMQWAAKPIIQKLVKWAISRG